MLWVPPSAHEERLAVDADREALIDREALRQLDTVKRFNSDLKRLDPYLELVFITTPRDWPSGQDAPPGVTFDRWHLLRHNPDAPDTAMAIVGPDGEYVEPNSGVFERLAQSDMWNDQAHARARKREARRLAEKQRARDDRNEADRWEIAGRIKAALNPGVNFGVPGWTNRAGARKG